jgi:arabinose-5-phosphate isomerase
MLVPIIKKRNHILIGLTAKLDSFLAKKSDHVIYTYVKKEACPNNLAPTTSTTVQLAIGDAIAMSLLSLNKINPKDFAELHPGGQLGKSLTMTLGELINKNEKPIVNYYEKIESVINEISSKRLGATIVIKNKKIVGIITDGDIRRMLQKFDTIKNITAEKIMTKNPIKKENKFLASKARKLMSKKKINHIVVVNKNKKYIGIVHVLDLINEGF